jgi:hypothetical protein
MIILFMGLAMLNPQLPLSQKSGVIIHELMTNDQ